MEKKKIQSHPCNLSDIQIIQLIKHCSKYKGCPMEKKFFSGNIDLPFSKWINRTSDNIHLLLRHIQPFVCFPLPVFFGSILQSGELNKRELRFAWVDSTRGF